MENDFVRRHMARWQAVSTEDWQAVLKAQGYSEERVRLVTRRAVQLIQAGEPMRKAREQALDDYEWHSSGQF